ncbi:MAG TPA: lipase secretion chaperone [Arenimonas sp.]|uniref:lipase secretion chaperone n=1 Tax=Arenimonas sp. TaxID=1872635 RepID=UPI002CD4AB8F|nr:lipase secretion chaperone [Arenimonas sp.]HMB57011.1 lipase secretion chaperone [Arenimonas sp.]
MRGRLAIAACAMAAIAIWWFARPAALVATLPVAIDQRVTPVVEDATGVTRAAVDARVTTTAAANDSLRGTDVDGAVTVAANGQLQVDRELRRLFDYFLTRLGERSLATIRSDLATYLATKYARPVCAAALEYFDRYVALLDELSHLAPSSDARADLRRLHALRLARLGAAVTEAWYGREERYLENTIDRQAVLADTSLSTEQRQARLDALAAQLDPAERSARAPTDAMAVAVAQTESFDENHASAAQRFAERSRLYGSEAARRLAQLDADHAAWDGRLAAYAAQRQRLLQDSRLDSAARARALAALLSTNFDERERLRVEALTRSDALPPHG